MALFNHYYIYEISILGGAEILPAGEHFFQYSMVLPHHLPPSFEGKYGHIRYTVKGILDNPWKLNHEVVTSITLLSQVDLNFDSRYRVSCFHNSSIIINDLSNYKA